MAKPDSPMPVIRAFVDAVRDAFGAEEINAIVRRGRAGEPVFFACENGMEFGTRLPAGRTWNAVAVGDRHFCKGCNGSCVESGLRCSEHRARATRQVAGESDID
jgi:hypothetical protein